MIPVDDPADPDPERFDPGPLVELASGDQAFLNEFVALFDRDSRRLQDDFRQGLERQDLATIHRSAHAIKGMLSYFGDTPATRLTEPLETLTGAEGWEHGETLVTALIGALEQIRCELARLVD